MNGYEEIDNLVNSIDINAQLDNKIDSSIKELLALAEVKEYTKSELGMKINSEETLEEYIRDSELEFGLKRVDLEGMSDRELNDYIRKLDSLW